MDIKVVITGSYNWTQAAANHKENIVIIEDLNIARQFESHLADIVSANHQKIIRADFAKCTKESCGGRIFKIKVIYFRQSSKYSENEAYTLAFCTEAIEHLEVVTGCAEIDYIGDLIEYEYDSLENELQDRRLKHWRQILNQRVEVKIAASLNTRLDVFVEEKSHAVFGLYKIVTDMEGDSLLKSIWEHALISDLVVEGYENEIIEKIDYS